MTTQTRTRLLLIRHRRRREAEGRYCQHACPGLDEIGISQAQALAKRLARDATLTKIDILASQGQRSYQTAEMEQRFGPSYAHVPGAEAFSEFFPRACAALEVVVTKYEGRQILAVTHSGIIRAAFVAFGKMPVAQTMQSWFSSREENGPT